MEAGSPATYAAKMPDQIPERSPTGYVFGENGTVVGHATLAAPVETPSPLKLRNKYALLWA